MSHLFSICRPPLLRWIISVSSSSSSTGIALPRMRYTFHLFLLFFYWKTSSTVTTAALASVFHVGTGDWPFGAGRNQEQRNSTASLERSPQLASSSNRRMAQTEGLKEPPVALLPIIVQQPIWKKQLRAVRNSVYFYAYSVSLSLTRIDEEKGSCRILIYLYNLHTLYNSIKTKRDSVYVCYCVTNHNSSRYIGWWKKSFTWTNYQMIVIFLFLAVATSNHSYAKYQAAALSPSTANTIIRHSKSDGTKKKTNKLFIYTTRNNHKKRRRRQRERETSIPYFALYEVIIHLLISSFVSLRCLSSGILAAHNWPGSNIVDKFHVMVEDVTRQWRKSIHISLLGRVLFFNNPINYVFMTWNNDGEYYARLRLRSGM